MKQNERRVSPGAQGRSFHQRTDRSGGARPADVRVVVHISGVFDPPSREPGRHPIPPAAHGPRFRHWGVEQPGASYPFRVESDAPARDASSAVEAWRAVVALAAGLTLAVLSYAQFRGARGELPVSELTAALGPVVPSDTPDVEPATGAPDVVAIAIEAPAPPVERRRSESRGGLASARPTTGRRAPSVVAEPPRHETPAASATPEVVASRAAAAPVDPPPATIDRDERAAAPDSPTPAAAARAGSVPGDEDHIRAALARWRTAYSELDARAAREVWPSVDARALERAFHALKSQELHFERCDLTVNGGSARAACTGRAIYVPRIGKQSPRTTSREWTFELKKSDERWTIASARSS